MIIVACSITNPWIVKGRVFCFLPLPTETGLPVHVNGCFELSLNRRDVWHGEDLSGEGKKKVDWNNRLKQDVVGSAYAALIEQTAASIAKTNQLEYLIQFYEQWPNIKSTNSYWNDLSESVYSYLITNQAKVSSNNRSIFANKISEGFVQSLEWRPMGLRFRGCICV